jgi:hypothetical protein
MLNPDQLQDIEKTFKKRPHLQTVYVYDDGEGFFFDPLLSARFAQKGVAAFSREDVSNLIAGKPLKTVPKPVPDLSALPVEEALTAVNHLNKAQLTEALTQLNGTAPDPSLKTAELKAALTESLKHKATGEAHA